LFKLFKILILYSFQSIIFLSVIDSLPGGNYLYEYGALSTLLGRNAKPIYTNTSIKKEEIVYARVSSAKQAGDRGRLIDI